VVDKQILNTQYLWRLWLCLQTPPGLFVPEHYWETSYLQLVSDIAVFVLKRNVKLQLIILSPSLLFCPHSRILASSLIMCRRFNSSNIYNVACSILHRLTRFAFVVAVIRELCERYACTQY